MSVWMLSPHQKPAGWFHSNLTAGKSVRGNQVPICFLRAYDRQDSPHSPPGSRKSYRGHIQLDILHRHVLWNVLRNAQLELTSPLALLLLAKTCSATSIHTWGALVPINLSLAISFDKPWTNCSRSSWHILVRFSVTNLIKSATEWIFKTKLYCN